MHDTLNLPELLEQGLRYQELIRKRNRYFYTVMIVAVLIGVVLIILSASATVAMLIIAGWLYVTSNFVKYPGQAEIQSIHATANQLFQEQMAQVPNELPTTEAKTRTNWLPYLILIGVFFVLTSINATNYFILGAMLLVFTILIMGRPIYKFVTQPSNPDRRHEIRTVLSGLITFLSIMLFAIPLMQILRHVFENLIANDSLAIVLTFIAWFVTMMVILRLYLQIPTWLVQRRFKSGDYEGALSSIRTYQKFLPSSNFLASVEASALILLKRYEEARTIILNHVPRSAYIPPFVLAAYLTNLAYTLADVDPALTRQLRENAIILAPSLETSYRHVALHYIKYELYPEQTVELTEQMMKFLPSSRSFFGSQKNRISLDFSVHSIALANIGKHEQADLALQQAFTFGQSDNKQLQAVLLLHKALVQKAQGDIQAAIDSLHKSLANDPRGISAVEARELLAQWQDGTD